MSVINESQPGDELVCIMEFSGSPDGVRRSWGSSRTFHVGERIRYAGFRRDNNLIDNAACWMVLFDADDGNRYAAAQTYFVTEDCWQGLKEFFTKNGA